MSDKNTPHGLTPAQLPSPILAEIPSTQKLADYSLDCVCPNCGALLVQEKCKVVCRSNACVYRIILNCSEF